MNLYIYISVYRGLLYHQEYHNFYLSVPHVLLWQITGLNVTDLNLLKCIIITIYHLMQKAFCHFILLPKYSNDSWDSKYTLTTTLHVSHYPNP